MRGDPKNDATIMRAIAASNRGDHYGASCLYNQAGNQMRDPKEKSELWQAAERAKRIHFSD